MLGIEGRQGILEKLRQDRKVYVSGLSQLFGVTEETIRRDLEKLEKEGMLRRSYGGAVPNDRTGEDLSFLKRSGINSDLKAAIAKAAAPLVQDGDTLMMDSSTTGLALLQCLLDRKQLTVITNSIRLAYDFTSSPFRIISTGGTLRAHSCALTGRIACQSLQQYYVDLAIFSCKGIDRAKGVMESNEDESIVKQHMIAQARKSILLVDHTKFDKTAFTTTCGFSSISTVVTDRAPGREWRELFDSHEVDLVV